MISRFAKSRRWVLALLFLPLAVGLVDSNRDYWIGVRALDDADLIRIIRACYSDQECLLRLLRSP